MLYQTHMRVSLRNIRKNLEMLRARIGSDTKLLLTVKCNGYGLGSVGLASMAEREGLADWFGVATVTEGIEIREAGIRLPILKLSHAFPEEMEAAIDYRITLAVCERSNIQAFQDCCAAKGTTANVHLKVETGLGRIGVTPDEAPGLATFLEKECPNLHLEGVFTQMAVSGTPQGDAYTKAQVRLFKDTTDRIVISLRRIPELVHCANTGLVMRQELDARFTMVRVGQAAFGTYSNLAPAFDSLRFLQGLSSVRTRVSFLKKVREGTPIGYGLIWKAPEDTWIGTIPVGWADGLNRRFSNCGKVLVNGKAYPIVGTMCMDQSMINLGRDTDVRVGDDVVIIGQSGDQEITVEELAEAMNTVPYELICQFSARVGRVYEA